MGKVGKNGEMWVIHSMPGYSMYYDTVKRNVLIQRNI